MKGCLGEHGGVTAPLHGEIYVLFITFTNDTKKMSHLKAILSMHLTLVP